ncbi:Isocitrate lyase/phosphoenolpyruvate mutase family protein [Sulfidibacter corallicola]|uniref:Isocitrate lyase/phosphoenolpyruvate mutase family protein n=1 Tax=Sulfidibacter corallicola TaxID=2818388 RepID=A0A8A4TH00_SULCO|nr:isocitrate lyase/phosphoenolpyruvate mutase family protein [Sulfidibacter corallicola]QTD48830.1 isocitrate lyase/phosphoenolpyruvate mutase family protein [Sulfidibacter corallicola]
MNQRVRFQQLHQKDEVLFLPNAWDLLSAIVLEQTGFKAIGTTSWGMANAMGFKDGERVGFDDLLSSVAKMVAAVAVPVTVDIESGYGDDVAEVVENVLKVAGLGAAGINIEDSFKRTTGLRDRREHGTWLSRIRSELDKRGFADFFINARIDTYFQLDNPLEETIERAREYAAGGADGIFVPGVSALDDIGEIVRSVDKPLNVMSLPNMTEVAALERIGVKRFSIGNALSDATVSFVERRARAIFETRNTADLYLESRVQTVFQ